MTVTQDNSLDPQPPLPEQNAQSIAELRQIVESAIECIPQFEQRWNNLEAYLEESKAREVETRDAIATYLERMGEAASKRNQVVVKSARMSARTAKIVLGCLLLVGIVGLLVVYGDPAYLQDELQRYTPLVVPGLLWAALELIGVNYERLLGAIGHFMGLVPSPNSLNSASTQSTQQNDRQPPPPQN